MGGLKRGTGFSHLGRERTCEMKFCALEKRCEKEEGLVNNVRFSSFNSDIKSINYQMMIHVKLVCAI